ncbi:MAG: nuclease A inhibitor family protein [Gemmatimonadota bacterium]|nr:nuclease A inhibitor family protein [Gemmatimonadota bacterium]
MLRSVLEDAARDLVYSSESDEPFAYIEFADDGTDALDAERFRARAGISAGATIAERSLDDFLARHIETSDPFDARTQAIRPRYERLKSVLREQLSGVRVFRTAMPGDVRIRCYIVGHDSRGQIAGLVTDAVET